MPKSELLMRIFVPRDKAVLKEEFCLSLFSHWVSWMRPLGVEHRMARDSMNLAAPGVGWRVKAFQIIVDIFP